MTSVFFLFLKMDQHPFNHRGHCNMLNTLNIASMQSSRALWPTQKKIHNDYFAENTLKKTIMASIDAGNITPRSEEEAMPTAVCPGVKVDREAKDWFDNCSLDDDNVFKFDDRVYFNRVLNTTRICVGNEPAVGQLLAEGCYGAVYEHLDAPHLAIKIINRGGVRQQLREAFNALEHLSTSSPLKMHQPQGVAWFLRRGFDNHVTGISIVYIKLQPVGPTEQACSLAWWSHQLTSLAQAANTLKIADIAPSNIMVLSGNLVICDADACHGPQGQYHHGDDPLEKAAALYQCMLVLRSRVTEADAFAIAREIVCHGVDEHTWARLGEINYATLHKFILMYTNINAQEKLNYDNGTDKDLFLSANIEESTLFEFLAPPMMHED